MTSIDVIPVGRVREVLQALGVNPHSTWDAPSIRGLFLNPDKWAIQEHLAQMYEAVEADDLEAANRALWDAEWEVRRYATRTTT